MTCFRSFLLFGAATCLLAQTPAPSTPVKMPDVHLQVENAQAPPPAVPPDRVIITVGDVKITAAEFDRLVGSLQPQYQAVARANGRKQFADNIVQVIILAQEAERRKLTETDDFRTRAFFQSKNLEANALAEQLNKEAGISEADLRKYFDDHKAEFEQVHARHILIRFQGSAVPVRPGAKDLSDGEALAKAKEIRAKIQAGLDFAEVAKLESDDTGSGANGGDLNFFRHGQMVPSFEQAAFALKVGEISEPVKSQFGYHIIQVLAVKGFDEAKAEVDKAMRPQVIQASITKATEQLVKEHPPVFDPEFFASAGQKADPPVGAAPVSPDKK